MGDTDLIASEADLSVFLHRAERCAFSPQFNSILLFMWLNLHLQK